MTVGLNHAPVLSNMMTVGHDRAVVGYDRATAGHDRAAFGHDHAAAGNDLTEVGHGFEAFLACKTITLCGGIEDGWKQGLYPQKH